MRICIVLYVCNLWHTLCVIFDHVQFSVVGTWQFFVGVTEAVDSKLQVKSHSFTVTKWLTRQRELFKNNRTLIFIVRTIRRRRQFVAIVMLVSVLERLVRQATAPTSTRSAHSLEMSPFVGASLPVSYKK
uniref:Secreted protein n=1 Tax=Photinus pyralis TaxID=7054 RepID=A0A1Y1L4Z3_PHOPY